MLPCHGVQSRAVPLLAEKIDHILIRPAASYTAASRGAAGRGGAGPGGRQFIMPRAKYIWMNETLTLLLIAGR